VSNLGNANIIKALLIDFIEEKNLIENCIYGNELFYGLKKRQTDLLAVNGSTTAFEIKSKSDDYRKTREQLDDYKKVFDFHYLVTTACHEKKAKKILKANEGLIIIENDNTFTIKRPPKRVTKHSKVEILETIPLAFLKKHFKINSKIKTVSEVRAILKNKTLNELRETLRVFLKERLTPRNNLFFEEKGKVTHFEDLKLLSQNQDQII
jgi:hypothetical protein